MTTGAERPYDGSQVDVSGNVPPLDVSKEIGHTYKAAGPPFITT